MATLLLPLLHLLLPFLSLSSASQDLLHQSCRHASYPGICLRTLSSSSATTPHDVALSAVKVSLRRAKHASIYLTTLKNFNGKSEKNALTDCLSQMTDSVDELSKTLAELKHLRRGSEFKWQMSNAETWVSAALTNEDTCMDGFKEADHGHGKMSDVKRRVRNVAKVTSNALYLINRLDKKTTTMTTTATHIHQEIYVVVP